ncbi:hypothetical protein FVA74_10290 [Salinibacterium sp. dk2585]|uniref:hypothetical protein n=1 Tax=unclassified Salinibacterium TaxID=2632331 RepID=UPI0011C25835|nr:MULTISPECIES: hypothetical protein [unclassified Salinibacterium]QEE61913.1 hypothetical protein FVA74_10290 [Salinibacterium sp. dk2585]TXK54532.1 hypothetical protein FVP63_05670 [Salinibacterium sp. dk5596]
MRRGITAALLALAASGVLVGCSTGPALFEEARDASDTLPTNVEAEGYDLDTVRLLGERDGVSYFAARSTANSREVCIIAHSVEEWVGGCMQEDGLGELYSAGLGGMRFVPDGAPEREGWDRLHPNLDVRP